MSPFDPFKFTRNRKVPCASQLVPELRAQVIFRSGRQTLEIAQTAIGEQVCLTDGWISDWITFYQGKWFTTGQLAVNKPIQAKLTRMAQALKGASA